MDQGPPGVDNPHIRGSGVGSRCIKLSEKGIWAKNLFGALKLHLHVLQHRLGKTFFGILEQITIAISCYFLLWGD